MSPSIAPRGGDVATNCVKRLSRVSVNYVKDVWCRSGFSRTFSDLLT